MTEAPQLTMYQVASDDPQYAGATYVLDELDGDLLVYLEDADGSVLDVGLIYADELEGLSESELLEEVDQRLRDSLLPPRGERRG
ncbi:hypothetical protein [Mycolicibacterium sp.]|uniref:hypothetical protein n=1 Tax=Mycolicibacterium sp. TaxID=2320850 RepID=UPI0037CA9E8C